MRDVLGRQVDNYPRTFVIGSSLRPLLFDLHGGFYVLWHSLT